MKININSKEQIKIFAIDVDSGDEFEIADLYWFEEEGIHDFDGESIYAKYTFRIELTMEIA